MTDCTHMFQGMRFLVGTASYQNAEAVTPSDTEDLPIIASALWIGSAGTLKVDMEISGTGITFSAVPVGIFKGRIKKVYADGTGAGDIIALW